MPLPGRRGAPADWLIVGMGNPGAEYAHTRHNVGFKIAELLIERWQLSKPKRKFKGLLSEGRIGTPGVDTPVRAAVLMPQTHMNDAGRSVGPARGALGIEALDHVLVLHDEIDIPFGEMVGLDYRYVTSWSLAYDIKLMFMTFAVLARSTG